MDFDKLRDIIYNPTRFMPNCVLFILKKTNDDEHKKYIGKSLFLDFKTKKEKAIMFISPQEKDRIPAGLGSFWTDNIIEYEYNNKTLTFKTKEFYYELKKY